MKETMEDDFDGKWVEPEGIPRGQVQWLPPGKGGLKTYVATVDGKVVAVVRGNPYHAGWVARVPGWKWLAPMSGSVAEKLKIADPNLKGFQDIRNAKQAVEHALATLPPLAG